MEKYPYKIDNSDYSKKQLEFSVIHHQRNFKESLETLNAKLNDILEHAYSGNFVETIRAARAFKEESQHLTTSADHLLISIEKLAEPDHGGD